MENIDVVKKLIGEIYPIGETNEDNKRFENLKELCILFDEIHTIVDDIAWKFKDRSEYSIKRAGEYCDKHLDKMGIRED